MRCSAAACTADNAAHARGLAAAGASGSSDGSSDQDEQRACLAAILDCVRWQQVQIHRLQQTAVCSNQLIHQNERTSWAAASSTQPPFCSCGQKEGDTADTQIAAGSTVTAGNSALEAHLQALRLELADVVGAVQAVQVLLPGDSYPTTTSHHLLHHSMLHAHTTCIQNCH